jgi:hypothetical protein
MRTLAYLLLSALSLLYACGGSGGGSSSGSGGSGGGGGTTPPATGSFVVLAANDLGMHCMDREFRFSPSCRPSTW